MKVRRVGFVGARTPNVEATAGFFRDLLGLEMVRDDSTWSILRLPTGPYDLLEVYGSDFDDERLAPPDQPLFVSFVVDDVLEARQEITAAGLEAGDLVWASDVFEDPEMAGFGWFFFRAPDALFYIIQHVPDASPPTDAGGHREGTTG